MKASLGHALESARRLLELFVNDPQTLDAMDAIAESISQCFRSGGKLLCAGNGGSLADAMHLAEEFTGRFRNDRVPLPAIALADPSHMSCVANDFGFDHVFARPIQALANPGDVVVLLTTSGNSPNLVAAAQAGHAKGATVIGLVGRGGGQLAPLCHLLLHAPGEGSDRIQELHMLALHAIIESVEQRLGLAEG